MSTKFTKENLIARRDELAAEIKAIEEISGPKREARDKLVRESDEAIKTLNDEIRKIEVGLFDLKMKLEPLRGRSADASLERVKTTCLYHINRHRQVQHPLSRRHQI